MRDYTFRTGEIKKTVDTYNLFSTSGRLAYKQKGGNTLTVQTRVAANVDGYMPPITQIWNRYKEKYGVHAAHDDEPVEEE